MSNWTGDKGESSRSTGPSDQSREVHILRQPPTAGPGSSFRWQGGTATSQPGDGHGSQSFAAFVDQPGSLLPLGSSSSSSPGGGPAFSEARAADGAAVVDLLSQPDGYEAEAEAAAALPLAYEMSTAEMESLRVAIFESGASSRPVPWDNLLNFTPSYVRNPDHGPQAAGEAELHLGTSDPQATQASWVREWSQVLSSYTDEVWGDLSPLAAEARREVDDLLITSSLSRDEPPQPPKALSRLRMILAHVQKSGTADNI